MDGGYYCYVEIINLGIKIIVLKLEVPCNLGAIYDFFPLQNVRQKCGVVFPEKKKRSNFKFFLGNCQTLS